MDTPKTPKALQAKAAAIAQEGLRLRIGAQTSESDLLAERIPDHFAGKRATLELLPAAIGKAFVHERIDQKARLVALRCWFCPFAPAKCF